MFDARRNFVRKVCELAVQYFIGPDTRPNVKGLIFAGTAEMKSTILKSKLLDKRLKDITLATITVAYGNENGLQQAIEKSSEVLQNLTIVEETKILSKLFKEMTKDEGRYCTGAKETMTALVEYGAVDVLLCSEKCALQRCVLTDPEGKEVTLYLFDEREVERYIQEESYTLIDAQPLIDWLVEHHANFGARLRVISDSSPQGSMLAKGLGGIAALLRWHLEFQDSDDPEA